MSRKETRPGEHSGAGTPAGEVEDEEDRAVRMAQEVKRSADAATSLDDLISKMTPEQRARANAVLDIQRRQWETGTPGSDVSDALTVASTAALNEAQAQAEEASARVAKENADKLTIALKSGVETGAWDTSLPSVDETVRLISYHRRAYGKFMRRAERLRAFEAERPQREASERAERERRSVPVQQQLDQQAAELASLRAELASLKPKPPVSP